MSSPLEVITPRSELEAKLLQLQKDSDALGIIIYEGATTNMQESREVLSAKLGFNRLLAQAERLTEKHLGDKGIKVGWEARYIYNNPNLEKGLPQDEWKLVLPVWSMHLYASLEGEVNGVTLIKARSLEGQLSWRICARMSAYRVMGAHFDSEASNRIAIAVPLEALLILPVTNKEENIVAIDDNDENYYNRFAKIPGLSDWG